MVFSSIPQYLDPSNWQQQQAHHQIIGSTSSNPLLPPPPPQQQHGPTAPSSIRPGSMSDRARLANIPLPEPALKCPRCESTNTKFCYFNNYSLSQPRHFCKTCRRYWTRGGALRNVPVGGGCRRNKRSKPSSSSSANSKSPAATTDRHTNNNNNNNNNNDNININNSNNNNNNILNLTPQIPGLRFMSPLSHLTTTTTDHNFNGGDLSEMSFNLLGSMGGVSNDNIDTWRLHQVQQQFPFLGGLEQSSSGINYQFHGGGEANFMGGQIGHNQIRLPRFSGSMAAPVKMEDQIRNPHELNLSRQLMGGLSNMVVNEQWNNNNNNNNDNNNDNSNVANWTELSSFSSSSTSNPL